MLIGPRYATIFFLVVGSGGDDSPRTDGSIRIDGVTISNDGTVVLVGENNADGSLLVQYDEE